MFGRLVQRARAPWRRVLRRLSLLRSHIPRASHQAPVEHDAFSTRSAFWCAPLAGGGRVKLWGRHFRRYAADETVVDEAEIVDLAALRRALRDRCGLRLL